LPPAAIAVTITSAIVVFDVRHARAGFRGPRRRPRADRFGLPTVSHHDDHAAALPLDPRSRPLWYSAELVWRLPLRTHASLDNFARGLRSTSTLGLSTSSASPGSRLRTGPDFLERRLPAARRKSALWKRRGWLRPPSPQRLPPRRRKMENRGCWRRVRLASLYSYLPVICTFGPRALLTIWPGVAAPPALFQAPHGRRSPPPLVGTSATSPRRRRTISR
jgi:hypothetical protein